MSRTVSALLSAALIAGSLALAVPAASAATATVSALDVSVVADGVEPFDELDADARNDVLRTNDRVTYSVNTSFATTGDITYTSTLPVGMEWDPSSASATVCTGGGALSNNLRTLTCARTAEALSEKFELIAWAYSVGNGTVVQPTITAAGTSAQAPAVTVAAVPKTEARFHSYVPQFKHNITYDGQLGFQYSYTLYLGATNTGVPAGFRGYEALAETFDFDLKLPEDGVLTEAVPSNGSVAVAQSSPGADATVTVTGMRTDYKKSSIISTWSDFNYINKVDMTIFVPYDPTLPAGEATAITTQAVSFDPVGLSGTSNFGTGYSPGHSPDTTCVKSAVDQTVGLSCFRFTVDRTQTYLVAAATGGVMQTLGAYLVGDGHFYSQGWEKVVPGQGFIAATGLYNKAEAQAAATSPYNAVVWDNTYLRLTAPAVPVFRAETSNEAFFKGLGTPIAAADYVLEYSATTYASDVERKAADTGIAGDGAPGWVTDPATLPGGWDSVTSIRMATSKALEPGTAAGLQIPFARTTNTASLALPVDAPLVWFSHFGTAETPRTAAPDKVTGGSWVQAVPALVRAKTTGTPAEVEPGSLFTVTVKPVLIGPVGDGISTVSKNTTATVTLASTCSEPVKDSLDATGIPYDYTPGDFGPDGIPCTADDGAPAVVVFSLGDVTAPGGAAGGKYSGTVAGHETILAPISFAVTTSTLTPSGSKARATTVVAADTDPSKASWEGVANQTNVATDRTDFADVTIRGVAAFKGSKSASTADAGQAAPGEPFAYTISWGNGSPTINGPGTFVDLLPFEGDGRGTAGLGASGLTVLSVAAQTTTPSVMGPVDIWYTTDPSASVLAALTQEGNEDGHEGVVWTLAAVEGESLAVPAQTTALKFVTRDPIEPGYGGTATIKVEAPSLAIGGVLANNLYGLTEKIGDDPNSTLTFKGAAKISLTSSAGSVEGTVLRDLDFDGVVSAADGPWPAGTGAVRLVTDIGTAYTADLSADGRFSLPLVAPGAYTVEIVDGTGWAKVAGSTITVTAGETKTGLDALYQETVAAPVLNDDAAVVRQDASTSIDVTANDALSFPTTPASVFGAGTVSLGTGPTTGTVELVAPADGQTQSTFLYKAATAWPADHADAASYTDTFTYTWTNVNGVTEEATVAVTVTAVPAPVVASGRVTIPVGGYHDFAAAPVTERVIVSAVPDMASSDGALAATVDGVVSYSAGATPPGVYTGSVVFTDDLGRTATGTYEITVQAAPVVTGETATTIGEGQTTTFPMDIVGTVDTAVVSTPPAAGAATVTPEGVVTFEAGEAAPGVYTFDVTFVDDLGQTAIVTYTVTIQAKPVAVGGEVTIPEKGAHAFVEEVATAGTIVSRELTKAPDAGSATAAPPFYQAGDALGEDTFVVTYTDLLGQTATATFLVTVQARPTGEGSEVTIDSDVTRLVVDPLGDATGTGLRPLVPADLGSPAHGTVTVENGVVVYAPEPGFLGTVTFTVTVTDDLGQQHVLTYTVTIVEPGTATDVVDGAGNVVTPAVVGATAVPEGEGSVLATTGAQVVLAVGAAVVALAGGAALLLFSRRRRGDRPA